MLREVQIDIRRQRAKAAKFQIENLGKKRVFSDYRVTNPESGGQYTVSVKGFEVGDNTCTCPDFKSNTLGTCKHIEAVLDTLKDDLPAHLQKKKAAVTRPEIVLLYGEQLQLGIHLPPRYSDQLGKLAQTYFDDKGMWSGRGKYPDLIHDVEAVPEEVTVMSDALEFIDREIERTEMLAREQEWVKQLEAGTLDLKLLNVPLYDYQTRGALFLACRGRSILGDDMGLGKCIRSSECIFVGGTLVTAEDVWNRFAGATTSDGEGEWAEPTTELRTNALAWGTADERITTARIVRLYRQWIDEPVRTVVLNDGSEVGITRRHKLLGRDEWTNELAAGDVVCVPRRLVWDGEPADAELVELLAWQISEGCESPDGYATRITQNDAARLERLRALAASIGQRYNLRMNGMGIGRAAGKASVLHISSKAYRDFLEARGYQWGERSRGKRIPDWIVAADDATIRLFLRHYFSAEGSVCRSQRLVEIASASRWLMLQLRTMLRRFGIWMRIKRRMKRATNGSGIKREYAIGMLGGNAARLFRDLIGFDDPIKQTALEEVTAARANTNVEGLPVADLLSDAVAVTGLPQRHFGVGTQYFYNTQNLSRESVGGVVRALDEVVSGESLTAYRKLRRSKWTDRTLAAYTQIDTEAVAELRDWLARLARREVHYARVVEVREEHYTGWVYDYEVEGHHNFVAGDVLCHNTAMTLGAIELLARERGIQKALVVAPASVKYQWESEIKKFTGRPVQVIDGTPEARLDQYAQPTFYRLVNYEQVVRDREAINAWKPDVIVLDEAQRIKNWEAKTSREVKKLKSRYAMVLTGTPLENRLEELYSIVQFVDERRFGPAFQFLHEHRVLDDEGNLKGYRNLDKIRERLAPIFLRRTRGEVLTQLPARTDNTVFVELADEQRVPYEEQRVTLARLLQKNYLTDLDRKRILACVVNLRTVCDSLFLYDKQTRVSPKLDEFAELVPELIGEHKLVVFSQWETMAMEAAKVLDRLGIGYVLLHGGLPGKDRKAVLERFQTDPACKVFLSTDAGGTGLNLQTADTVVNLELPWNPAVLAQRIARVHRMGQNRPVRVINFVTRGTIEEKVLRTVEAKQGLFAGVFEGDADEIPFEAVNTSGFLDTMRELVNEEAEGIRRQETGDKRQETGDRKQETAISRTGVVSALTPVPRPLSPVSMWQGVAQIVEGACAVLADPTAAQQIPAEVRERVLVALRAVAANLGSGGGN